MANVASAEKRNRQRLRRRRRNLSHLSKVRSLTKRVLVSLAAKDGKASPSLKDAIRALDKAAQKGVIRKKTAARKISRLTRRVAAAK